jgi:hypothetical protein
LAGLMIFCPLGPNILWCVRWSFRMKSPQKINKIKKHDIPDLNRSLHRIRFYLEICLQFRSRINQKVETMHQKRVAKSS